MYMSPDSKEDIKQYHPFQMGVLKLARKFYTVLQPADWHDFKSFLTFCSDVPYVFQAS